MMIPQRTWMLILLLAIAVLAGSFAAATAASDDSTSALQAMQGNIQAIIGQPPPAEPASPPHSPTPAATREAAASDAPLQAARREVANGNPARAVDAYRELVATRGADPQLLFELGQAQMAAGEPGAALGSFEELMGSGPAEPLLSRTRLMEATARLELGDGRAMRQLAMDEVPDGLGDLAALRRAEAAVQTGETGEAANELNRSELRESTNRVILERAARLAVELGSDALAGELYARSTLYPAWTAQRSAAIEASAAAFARAGATERAIEQYQTLVEDYSWTAAAKRGAERLWNLKALTAYHAGLVALQDGRSNDARQAFWQAAATPEYAERAGAKISALNETEAWRSAAQEETSDAFRAFRLSYPRSSRVAEAWFQEGFSLYQAGQTNDALSTWDEASRNATGDNLARLRLWASKALDALGRPEEAQARMREAASVQPAGYYAIRARDLLAGVQGWPGTTFERPADTEAEGPEIERWIAEWAGNYSPVDPSEHDRGRRSLGLLALGLREEAAAEANALIADSDDPGVIFPLALRLVEAELWHSVYRAGLRLVALSPHKSVTAVPAAVQSLVYPQANWDLVAEESKRNGLDPWLFLSLVYQESRYDPYAVSPAEARGLTQVIPSTGQGIAKALKLDRFSPEQLHQPATSVRFGTWYLASLLSGAGGDPFRALAAYNAGTGPVARWSAPDPDLFVERIDYPETRSYVRSIYLHHAIYRSLATR